MIMSDRLSRSTEVGRDPRLGGFQLGENGAATREGQLEIAVTRDQSAVCIEGLLTVRQVTRGSYRICMRTKVGLP